MEEFDFRLKIGFKSFLYGFLVLWDIQILTCNAGKEWKKHKSNLDLVPIYLGNLPLPVSLP